MKTLFSSSKVLIVLSAFGWSAAQAADVNGDFRYRHEFVGQEGASQTAINQQRIRARLGVKAKLDDEATTEFRLATTTGRTSTNQTLGASANAFANYTFTLDRARFTWAPETWAQITAGRMASPFFAAGGNDLIFDGDLNFDGLSWRGDFKGETLSPFFELGWFWIDKTTTAGRRDVNLMTAQLGTKAAVNEKLGLNADLHLFNYTNVVGHNGFASTTDTNGNSFNTSGSNRVYARDFRIIGLGVDAPYQWTVGDGNKPLTPFVEVDTNLTAGDQRAAWIAGIKLGQMKERGDWQASYDYRRLAKDSTIGAFSDSDCFGGGADGFCHRISAGYQIRKWMYAAATYYLGQVNIAPGETSLDRSKLHLDWAVTF